MADSRKLALTLVMKGVDGVSGALRAVMGTSQSARDKLRALNDTLRDQKRDMQALKGQIADLGDADGSLGRKQAELEDRIARTTHQIDRQKQAVVRLAEARAKGQMARDKGMGNISVGIAIATPLALAGKMAADFQEGMTDIQQKSNLSAAATAKLARNIFVAARDAKQLPESMRAGVDYLTGAGLDSGAAMKMITPIGRAATAYRAQIEDLSRASFAVTDNLKVPFSETARAIDIMAQAGKDGNFEIADMAQYFPALTAQAQALGQTGAPAVADLAAALQIARKGAGDSASAATNVQDLLTKINAQATITKFKQFGIDLPKAMKKAYAEGKTPLEAIAELTNKATKGDLSKVGQLFTNQEAASALRPLIQNLDLYRQIRSEALNAKGVVDADFALRSQNAATQTRALMGNLSQLAVTVGDKLLPPMVSLSQKTLSVAGALIAWADKHPRLTRLIVGLVAAIALANLTLGTARVVYGSVVGPITAVSNAYTFLRTSSLAASAASGAARLIAGGWALMTAASGPFIASALSAAAATWAVAWPILAVIAACVAVTAAIVGVVWAFKHWDQITAWVSKTWDRLKAIIGSIDWLQLGKNILVGLINGLIGGIPMLIIAMGRVAMAGVDHFKKVLGIHSPSRVFAAMGGHITSGLTQGLDRGAEDPLRSVRAMAGGVALAGGLALSSGASAAPAEIHVHSLTITVKAHPGQSAEDIAKAVKEAFTGQIGKLTVNRSSFDDTEEG